jgi:hypothetical protein
MNKKKLLIITPFFAPQSHAAVFRAYKLAKYLPQKGWEIHVITTDTNYLYNEDQRLVEDLPPQVTIHRTRYTEPTLRGLRMSLGGKDRTFKSQKPASDGVAAESPTSSPKKSFAKSLYREGLRSFIHNPDEYWTWHGSAYKKALELIDNEGIPAVLTSTSPYTNLSIGRAIKEKRNIRWIADFRDPVIHDHRMFSQNDRIYANQRMLVKKAIETADKVTCPSSSIPLVFSDAHGTTHSYKFKFVPTGFETSLFPQDIVEVEDYLAFCGEYLPSYGDEFFKILNVAQKNHGPIKLKFIGKKEANEQVIRPYLEQFEGRVNVEFLDHMPQRELYKTLKKAKATLLITHRYYPWWCAFAKMTDYISLGRPVISVLPDPSEARKWLEKSGLGVFLDGDVQEAARTLEHFLKENSSFEGDPAIKQLFSVENQVDNFDKLLMNLIKESR